MHQGPRNRDVCVPIVIIGRWVRWWRGPPAGALLDPTAAGVVPCARIALPGTLVSSGVKFSAISSVEVVAAATAKAQGAA